MLIFPPLLHVKHVDPMVCPPLGIGYLAAHIRDGVEVKLLDALVEAPYKNKPYSKEMILVGLSFEDIIAQIKEYKPDLVGISCIFTSQFISVVALAKLIKEQVDPEIVIVTGGTHPSFLPERSLNESIADYIILGEGEITFKELINVHNQNGKIENLDGIAFRDNGAIRINKRINYIQDLDSLPFPARDLLPMEKYFEVNMPMALHWRKRRNTSIITSRGCPYHCTFCSSTVHWGNRYRYRSPDNVLSEIQLLKDDFGVEELKFQDDNFSLPRWRIEAILKGMIDRHLAMPWNTPNGVAIWTFDEDLIKLMKQSGCFEITLSIESGDPYVLKNIIKKPLDLKKAKEISRLLRKYKISTYGYFILGLPGENMGNIRNTISFANELKLDYAIPFIYNPLPGSTLFDTCIEKGYLKKDFDPGNVSTYYSTGINSDEFDLSELTKLQKRTYFSTLLHMPFRNPRLFIDYYLKLFLTRPNFLKTLWKHLCSAV